MSLEYVIFAGCALVLVLTVGFVGLVIFGLILRGLWGLLRGKPKSAVATPLLAPREVVSVSDQLDAERAAKAKATADGIHAMCEHLARQETINARMKAVVTAASATLDKAAPPNA